ncbi:Monothiol glutaredoxin-3 [Daldinia childiae]|uniref:Monothiol glutaredoxin-3 n=1 Tax=Daldinia childiae TaxID=326645 RepID=UPI0014488F70|nr:Monothiol glutaredoxin-3 [Daldinia childiae]KAF3061112.1 Monothiol glutaredoxin-3 [Daldinia childiae]
MGLVKEITSQNEWETFVGSLPKSTILIIFFHAPWAAPCAQMAKVIETLANDYSAKDAPPTSWVSINAEELSDVSEIYDVVAVPYVVLQKNDQVLDAVSGSNAAALRKVIETHAPLKPDATNGNKPDTIEEDSLDRNGDVLNPEEELNKRLTGLVSAAPVMLFMKGTPSEPKCGFSRQLVNLLRERSVKYGFFNILADDDVRQGLKKFADWPTYPQLWVSGELVGGLDIVKEELEKEPNFFKSFSVSKGYDATAA